MSGYQTPLAFSATVVSGYALTFALVGNDALGTVTFAAITISCIAECTASFHTNGSHDRLQDSDARAAARQQIDDDQDHRHDEQ